jgi:hypothetical protein
MKSAHISVRIPPKLHEELRVYVEQNGLSKTEVVVSALAEYLQCQSEVSLSQKIVNFEKRLAQLETKVNYDSKS